LTLRADGRVGIGHTQPTAYLEVKCTGIGNPETNGLLVHNHDNGDSIMSAQAESLVGNAFSSYILSDGANRSGWSVGVANNNDFRISQNHEQVVDPTTIALYISDSDRNVGIGTDAPRDKLEVNGNVTIGTQLTFGGVLNDEFGNTFIRERLYDADDGISELLFFKGTDSTSGAGPDRIRSIAAEHLFQIYSTNTPITGELIEDAIENGSNLSRSLLLRTDGKIMMGDPNPVRETALDAGTTLFVNGGLEFGSTQKLKFGNLDIFTSGGFNNTFDSLGTSPIVFKQNDIEYARFTHEGLIGFGTSAPTANVHIYSGVTADIDVLKLESPGTNTKTGIRLNTNNNYGGYVRGYSESGSIHGIVVGGMNNGAEADGLHVIHTSNVGVGTSAPMTQFHVYNGTARVESATSSNAIIEIKTTGGVSNIYGDVSGNVYIDPYSNEMIINSNLEITGDLSIDGKIDLGNQVAVDLGEATANTALHVGGGFISGSNEVACKRYSKTLIRLDSKSKDIQFRFGNGAFYAKIIAMVRRLDSASVRDMSTIVLEVQGGTHNESTGALDEIIAVGTKNIFSADTEYPWSSTVSVGTKGLIITPFDPSADRQYSYDIYVELVTSKNGGVLGLFTGNTGGPDDFSSEEIPTSFGY